MKQLIATILGILTELEFKLWCQKVSRRHNDETQPLPIIQEAIPDEDFAESDLSYEFSIYDGAQLVDERNYKAWIEQQLGIYVPPWKIPIRPPHAN